MDEKTILKDLSLREPSISWALNVLSSFNNSEGRTLAKKILRVVLREFKESL